MTDIVERLREIQHDGFGRPIVSSVLKAAGEAADEIERLRVMLRRAEDIARNGCLVPPDGGSPTESERLMCEALADRIRALWTAKP